MRVKPTTTYHLASPKTWALIRAAYLSGLSAPALAARFGSATWRSASAPGGTAGRKRPTRSGSTGRALRGQGSRPLEQTVDLEDSWGDDPFEEEARHSLLSKAVFEMAIELSQRLAEGRPLPAAYADLHAELVAARARDAEILAAQDAES